MLTGEAYAERKWASFPALRQVLEGKPLEADQWRTSIDEGAVERVGRLFDVATIALERTSDVWDVARTIGIQEVHTDIERLVGELDGIVGWFAELKRRVDELHAVIERPEKPGSAA